jgi:DNA invertase Pin-like site-specific DNA recombinase
LLRGWTNDSLVIGMKGTFAQAELHIIRARLHGGRLNKGQKGTLRFPLLVGLVYDGDNMVLDPKVQDGANPSYAGTIDTDLPPGGFTPVFDGLSRGSG